MEQNLAHVIEAPVITKSGEIRNAAIRANIIELGKKKIVQAIFRDITAQKKAEEHAEPYIGNINIRSKAAEMGNRGKIAPRRKVQEQGRKIVQMCSGRDGDLLGLQAHCRYQQYQDHAVFLHDSSPLRI